jgi:predicted XRE-type DNA-binding protein
MLKETTVANSEIVRLRTQVAAAIQAAVKAEGLSTVAAAELTGVHRSEFSRLMNGHFQKFGLHRLVNIALMLGIRCSLRLVRPKTSE